MKPYQGGDSSPVRQTEFGQVTLNEQSMKNISKRDEEILKNEEELEKMRCSKGWRPTASSPPPRVEDFKEDILPNGNHTPDAEPEEDEEIVE